MTDHDSRGSIVVPSGSPNSSVAFHRSLGKRGIHTIAVSEREDAPSFTSRYCGESVVVPDPASDLTGYREALLSLAERPGVRTVAPLREEDAFVLAKYRSAFERTSTVFAPSFDQLAVAHDGLRLRDLAAEAGVPVPETAAFDEVDDWDRELIVKPRYAVLSDEYLPRRSTDGLEGTGNPEFVEPGLKPDESRLREEMGHLPLVQEYVRGPQYSFRALYDDGEPVVTSQKRLVRGYKYARGPSVFHRAVDRPGLAESGTALLDALDWHGPASVQFIRDSDSGEYKLLEVNPRFWASVPMDIAAGVDYPHYFWQLANGHESVDQPTYEAGTATHRLVGEGVHMLSVLFDEYPVVERPPAGRTVGQILHSLYAHPHFDLLDPRDPRPFVSDLLA
ncbi:MAG: ATP-grasp domain-containing protein [Natrialbaceae archaeon]